jgi:hypothetical protein
MSKVTFNVPAGISFDAAEIGGALRSIAEAMTDLAETQRRIAEADDPSERVALQISTVSQLRKVSCLTDRAAKALAHPSTISYHLY